MNEQNLLDRMAWILATALYAAHGELSSERVAAVVQLEVRTVMSRVRGNQKMAGPLTPDDFRRLLGSTIRRAAEIVDGEPLAEVS